MILKEFFTAGEQGLEQQKNYNAEDDISVLDKEDTRKTRLTLKDINKMRLASEQHEAEQQEERASDGQKPKHETYGRIDVRL